MDLLVASEEGSFVVRASSSQPGNFALTLKAGGMGFLLAVYLKAFRYILPHYLRTGWCQRRIYFAAQLHFISRDDLLRHNSIAVSFFFPQRFMCLILLADVLNLPSPYRGSTGTSGLMHHFIIRKVPEGLVLGSPDQGQSPFSDLGTVDSFCIILWCAIGNVGS